MGLITFETVINRDQLSTIDFSNLREYFRTKRVLVTGGGGTIGSEIVRSLVSLGVAEIKALDRDENALHSLQLSIGSTALFDDDRIILGDIRDLVGCRQIFKAFSPDLVIHAAALKHLSALELNPREALQTNVVGTHNILRVSKEFGVKDFINISTDKAANPISVLGKTKRVAEFITNSASEGTDSNYRSVRFGNVFASRGSVIETFIHQIQNGFPLTLTHRDVKRFFMSVNEASMLVLETAFLSNSGIYVLDMGEEVELFEISKRLMNILGREVPINITGLRPGEKLSEELVSSNEILEKTSQSKISYLQFASKSTWKDSEMNIPNNNVDSREKIDSLLEKLELGLSIESE